MNKNWIIKKILNLRKIELPMKDFLKFIKN